MPLGPMNEANGAERHFIKKKKDGMRRRRGKGRAKVAGGLVPPEASAGGQLIPAEIVPPPVASKDMTFPRRPGFGQVGAKCVVKANHFLAQLPDKDLNQYDVSWFLFLG